VLKFKINYYKEALMRKIFVTVAGIIIILTYACSQNNEPTLKETPETSKGAKLFATYCKGCHGEGATGDIGPNLTDDKWRYGGTDEDIFTTISNGRPGGMPSWKNTLSEDDIKELIEYIRSLKK